MLVATGTTTVLPEGTVQALAAAFSGMQDVSFVWSLKEVGGFDARQCGVCESRTTGPTHSHCCHGCTGGCFQASSQGRVCCGGLSLEHVVLSRDSAHVLLSRKQCTV
jgi:hypothetical protein